MQPPVCEGSETGMDLKSAALRFLRERCEGLCFSSEIEAAEEETGQYRGTSLRPNQIPYNMEKDIAKLADILGHGSINTIRIYIMTKDWNIAER